MGAGPALSANASPTGTPPDHGFTRDHECFALHRLDRLPVADVAEGFSALFNRSALFLRMEGAGTLDTHHLTSHIVLPDGSPYTPKLGSCPTTILSINVAALETRSSNSRGKICPLDCAIWHIGVDPRPLVIIDPASMPALAARPSMH
jgi:hypothetical protein